MTILAEYTLYRVIIVQLRELATWEGYGVRIIGDNDNIYPVLQLTNSSNTTAQICIFQWSIGQTVVLSGDVNIITIVISYITSNIKVMEQLYITHQIMH